VSRGILSLFPIWATIGLGEAIPVVGPGGDLRVVPRLVGDAGQPRQQQEAQIVEVGDRLGPDCGFYSCDVRCSTGPKRFGRFPVERTRMVFGE